MNSKVMAIIILLSLCFFIGFQRIYHYKIKTNISNIAELEILKYLPKDNKLLFISNLKSSNIINEVEKNFKAKNKDKLSLIKNSILDYLGIDLGTNKLEEVYNNEIIFSTFENNKSLKDDILIVFKINPEKNIDDILNIPNQIVKTDQIIPIYREDKLNYLKFIYLTKDNYIIASSDKKLIVDAINPNNYTSEKYTDYYKEIIGNLKSQNNILFSKESEKNLFFSNRIFPKNNEDIIATTFSLRDKDLILRSYLINKNKNLFISSYENLINKNIKDADNYPVSIYSDLESALNYINPLINKFEKSFLEELNQELNQNILLLSSDKDWIIAYENNNQQKLNINEIETLKSFNKYSLEKDNNVYSIYSKNILKVEENIVKQIAYEDIFLVESGGLNLISNNLIKAENINLISKTFFDLKSNTDDQDFLYQRIEIKGSNSYKAKYLSHFKDLNFLLKNIINFPNEEFIEVIKQSIPEREPIIYGETSLRLFS